MVTCPSCKREGLTGEDLGDNPFVLTVECECGNIFEHDVQSDWIEGAERAYQ